MVDVAGFGFYDTSQNYSDALAWAALCSKNNAVLVLADDKAIANASFPRSHRFSIKQLYVFDGNLAVQDKTFCNIVAAVC